MGLLSESLWASRLRTLKMDSSSSCWTDNFFLWILVLWVLEKKSKQQYTNAAGYTQQWHCLVGILQELIKIREPRVLWCAWTLTFFFFFYLFFLILYFFSFDFLFLFIDDEEACDYSHMTYHMMWGHRPRLGRSRLEGWY